MLLPALSFALVLTQKQMCIFLINFDFILYYNLLLCFIQLEMHVLLICAIKFYLLTYLLTCTRLIKSATKEHVCCINRATSTASIATHFYVGQ